MLESIVRDEEPRIFKDVVFSFAEVAPEALREAQGESRSARRETGVQTARRSVSSACGERAIRHGAFSGPACE